MATVGSTTDVQAAQQKTATAANQLNQNFDDFLRLLTTQLQNQDPLSPMDTAEFTNQLVMFSQVEQQLQSNDTLNKLLALQTLNMTALGVSFIGKNVEVSGSSFQADGASSVSLSYDMPADAAKGTITILDAEGNAVFSKDADLSPGRHDFAWNGMNDEGLMAPAGNYTIQVSAQTAENNSLNVTTYVPGRVTSLESAEDGTLMLNVNGMQVPLTSVTKISEPSGA